MPAHDATSIVSPFWSCPTCWHCDFGGWRSRETSMIDFG